MSSVSERAASFRQRRRAAGERPLEMWLDHDTLKGIDALKAEMNLPSRDAVIGRIIRAHLATNVDASAEFGSVKMK